MESSMGTGMFHQNPIGKQREEAEDYDGAEFYVWEDDFVEMELWERDLYSAIFAVLTIFGSIGNIGAIILVALQNNSHRSVYRISLISLAASDFLLVLSVGSYSLSMFSNEMPIWALGDFLCKAVPFTQVTAIFANSLTLCCIAVNRYRGIVHALQSRGQPNEAIAIILVGATWIIAIGCGLPNFWFYNTTLVLVLETTEETESFDLVDMKQGIDSPHQGNSTYSFCTTSLTSKNIYMSLMFFMIFLPLLSTFIVVYAKLGYYIWVRRPVGNIAMEVDKRLSNGNTSNQKSQMQKKIRTVKIIFILMFSFIICRCPIWIYNLFDTESNALDYQWVRQLKYPLSAFSLLSCVINPFLYASLHDVFMKSSPKCANVCNKFCLCLCCCSLVDQCKNLCHRNPPSERQTLMSTQSTKMSPSTQTTTKNGSADCIQNQVTDAQSSGQNGDNNRKFAWTIS